MSGTPEKIVKAREMIEQRKKELAENIKRKNEEAKKLEKLKLVEKQKKEIEKIKVERKHLTKVRKEDLVKEEIKIEDLVDPNPSSAYADDFESESGSELIERKVIDGKAQEPPVLNYDHTVIASKPKIAPTIDNPKKSIDLKPSENLENSSSFGKPQPVNLLKKQSDDFSPIISVNPIDEKPLTSNSSIIIHQNSLEFNTSLASSMRMPSILSCISGEIEAQKQCKQELERAKNIDRNDYFVSLSEALSEINTNFQGIRVKNRSRKNATFPSILISKSKDQEKQKTQEDSQISYEYSTPSFSEKDQYTAFETFNKETKNIEIAISPTIGHKEKPNNKTLENLPISSRENNEDDGQFEMIVVESNTEEGKKNQKWEERKTKRMEELEKRFIKKGSSPERLGLGEKLKINISSSPMVSPKPSPRPSLKNDIRSSPKPIHKTREEIKSTEDKYRRHKNLPNLVYNKPSNRKIIKNAISQLCLAGEPNKVHREEVLNVIDTLEEIMYFIIVFSDSTRRDVRGLYSHDPNTGEVNKIYGPNYLPETLESSVVTAFFRYDSGAKEFKQLQCKDFIAATDAVFLKKIHKVYDAM
ncbi:hypothetical protein SteCoe_17779 [Stentor coeruleus]|uniref:CKK domain-containing protein n=1 Tax=Stentor coeruleus TaxID=5963 RepID=A0A1R2BYK4_9CILI|nr:hypothetical protein SteCoe_17779 [Stentor coeruleus]